MAPSFVPSVLRVSESRAKIVAQILGAKKKPTAIRAELIEALGSDLAPGAWPTWLIFQADGALEDLLRLAPPMFRAASADGDEFYSEIEKPRLVYRGKGKGYALTPNSDEPKTVKVADAEIKRIDAYQTEGEVVLTDIRWLESAPKTRTELDKLLRTADRAFHGEIGAYEARDLAPERAPKQSAPVAPAAAGSGGMFLGGPDRSSFDPARGPRKTPKILWSAEGKVTGDEWGGYPVAADGLILAGDSSFNGYLGCVDAKTGKLLWEKKTATTQSWPANSGCVDRGVLYMATNHGLYAVDAKTGQDRWMAKASGICTSALVANELCIVGSKKSLDAHALETGRRKWSLKVKERVWSSPAYRDGVLFVRADQDLLALDALDGKTVRWKTKARDYGLGGPLLTEDSVIFEDEKRGLSAVDIATGKRRWAIAFGGVATPLASGGGVLLATDDRGRIHVFDARSGKKRWVYDSKEEDVFPSGGPAIAGDVVVAIVKSHLTGLDLESGKLLWKLRYPGTIAWRGKSTPAVRDGVIYVQEYGALHALR